MDPMLWEIAETATALRRAFDRRAVSLGVTRAQWRVLAKLSRTPGLRQVDLAEQLDMEAITLCRIVDRLAEAGLVERQADPQDRRAWKLVLTHQVQAVGQETDGPGGRSFRGSVRRHGGRKARRDARRAGHRFETMSR